MAFKPHVSARHRLISIKAFVINFTDALTFLERLFGNRNKVYRQLCRCSNVILMFFSEYLHEKAEESRHNETVGYLIIIIGSVFFVGGLLETVIKVENPEWLLIIPYHLTPHPYSLLGLALTSVGLVLLLAGIIVSIHYARERGWYMREILKAHSVEEKRLKIEKFSSDQSGQEQVLKTKKRKA